MKKPDLWGILFPRRCPVCHEIVEEREELACGICRLKLPYVRGAVCQRCGKPLAFDEQEYCLDCGRRTHFYQQGRAPFVYDEVLRRSISCFKYRGRREYAAFYAEEILKRYARTILLWQAEALVPIPLHSSRRRKRGFNQAELLAKELSRRSGIPMERRLLIRKKRTKAQKDLNDRERISNLKNAFSVREGKIPYKKIILVDDIYTTGSTVEEAARILKENGVQTVYFLSICVGRGC